MNGFHCVGSSGRLTRARQVVAELVLQPGMYIVFAKANVSIDRPSQEEQNGEYNHAYHPQWQPNFHRGMESIYQAKLEAGDLQDEMLGSLKYYSIIPFGPDDFNAGQIVPGALTESLSLTIAGEITRTVRARLVFTSATDVGQLWVWSPTISVIQVRELQVVTGASQPLGIPLSTIFRNNAPPGLTLKDMRHMLDSEFSTSETSEEEKSDEGL